MEGIIMGAEIGFVGTLGAVTVILMIYLGIDIIHSIFFP